MTENLIEAPVTTPTHREKGILRLARRYLRPVLTALLVAQTLTVPTPSFAEGNNPDDQETLQEYLVDVIIHRSLPQQKAEEWAIDAVNGHLNKRFADSGTSKRFRVDEIYRDYDEQTGCSIPKAIPVYDRCDFDDGKIRVWLHEQGFTYGGILFATSANPASAQVQMELPISIEVEQDGFYGQRVYGDELAHEVGHLFGLPDYYQEDVSHNLNQVAPIGIEPFNKDIMYNPRNFYGFSELSKKYIEKVDQLPIGFGEPNWDLQFTPKKIILEITDNEGNPLSGAKNEVFSQRYVVVTPGQITRIIPNEINFTEISDENGQVNLGNYEKLLHSYEKQGPFTVTHLGSAAFLRISHEGEVRYSAITRSYLNELYFQGNQDTALVSIPFTSLPKLEEGKIQYISAPGYVRQIN